MKYIIMQESEELNFNDGIALAGNLSSRLATLRAIDGKWMGHGESGDDRNMYR